RRPLQHPGGRPAPPLLDGTRAHSYSFGQEQPTEVLTEPGDSQVPSTNEGFMSNRARLILIAALACPSVATAQPVRKYDDKGAPPFKALKEGENPPLDAYDNFVIGPKYTPAPERKVVEGVPQGKVQQFDIDSKETKLLNPGIARKEFGKVDPKNPKTLIVETHNIDYTRKITVYIPAQYKAGEEAPFQVIHDGPGGKPSAESLHNFDNLIAQNRIPPLIIRCIPN